MFWQNFVNISAPFLACQPTSINRDNCSMHVASSIRGEKHDGPLEIIGESPPSSGYAIKNCLISTFVSAKGCRVVGCHIAWRYRVDIDIGRGPFVRQCPCQTG